MIKYQFSLSYFKQILYINFFIFSVSVSKTFEIHSKTLLLYYFYDELALISFIFLVEDCYDYFRAIVKTKEISERALELTKTAALLNPANYSVWQYR